VTGVPHVIGETLAVYGTLRRGFRNAYLTDGRAEHLGEGRLPGTLLHIGGPLRSYPYPGYVPGPDGPDDPRVVVEVLRVTDPGIWADLHALEGYDPADPDGSEYHPATVCVSMLDGRRITALTYVLNHSPNGWPVIDSGDWAQVAPRPAS
jgi:gamma-glutamylcyclotransferase (GGCT)/AIG2-like uncharacterized protein YtfP